MHRKLTLILLVLAASLTVGVGAALAGTTGGKDDPGVTPKTILLGGTAPLTGLASSYASISRGAEAYFKYVNARGGVNGRTITYRVLDDGYNAAQAVPLTRQLVEQDKVFAIFNAARHREQPRRAAVPQPVEGAAAVRRLRCDHVRP